MRKPDPTKLLNNIQEIVASRSEVNLEELRAKTRGTQKVSAARQLAMYIARVEFDISLSAIGRHFGRRHHTTVMHAVDMIDYQRSDKKVDFFIKMLVSRISKN